MNKSRLYLILFLSASIGGALYFSPFLQSPIVTLNHALKSAYLTQLERTDNFIDEHFNQQATIIDLRKKNDHYEKELLELHQIADEYQKLLKIENSPLKTQAHIGLIRTLSYVRMGDPHKLWIEMDHFNPRKVYGVLYRGYAAGIVVAHHGKPMVLLNGDPKSSYTVNVGPSMAPGIVRGNNSRALIVEFIPAWLPIHTGDEVITSGLDQIFLSGLKVGKVVSISKASGYQNAVIEPYFYAKNPAYFHVIRGVR